MPTFSAARGDSSFTDAHGVEIVYSTWRAGRPKGIVQIAHGVGEHGLRYEPLAQDLVRAGYTAHANDHRGHGRTGLAQWHGDHAQLGRLGPGGLRAAIAAVEQMSVVAREQDPGVPLVLLGHSWGSLMAQRIVNTSSERYDGVVLSATAYRLPGWMNSGDLNARHAGSGPTKHEWITRDRAVIEAITADPLAVEADVLKLFGVSAPDVVPGRRFAGFDRGERRLVKAADDHFAHDTCSSGLDAPASSTSGAFLGCVSASSLGRATRPGRR